MSDLTKLTAEELITRFLDNMGGAGYREIMRRLERLEKCEAALKIYAAEENWQRGRRDGPIDLWICCDEESWNGPDAARAALEGPASCHEPYKSGIKTTCHKCGAYPVEQARAAVEG